MMTGQTGFGLTYWHTAKMIFSAEEEAHQSCKFCYFDMFEAQN